MKLPLHPQRVLHPESRWASMRQGRCSVLSLRTSPHLGDGKGRHIQALFFFFLIWGSQTKAVSKAPILQASEK